MKVNTEMPNIYYSNRLPSVPHELSHLIKKNHCDFTKSLENICSKLKDSISTIPRTLLVLI